MVTFRVLSLAIAALWCSQACAPDETDAESEIVVSDTTSPEDQESPGTLAAVFDQLPASVEPSVILSEETPPRLVVSVGVAFQTMDFIETELANALGGTGFVRSADDQSVWTNDAGVRVDIGARPTTLVIDFSD